MSVGSGPDTISVSESPRVEKFSSPPVSFSSHFGFGIKDTKPLSKKKKKKKERINTQKDKLLDAGYIFLFLLFIYLHLYKFK